MRIIKFRKGLFSETANGNYYSRLYNVFCTKKMWSQIPDVGWGIIDKRDYVDSDGREFDRLELLAVFPSLSEAREVLLGNALTVRINTLREEEIDELIASL